MSLNLLDLVKGYFTNDMISKASGYLGESDATVRKGLDAVIPSTLAGIINKADSGDVESLLNLSRQSQDSGILNKLSDTFSSAGGGIPSISPGLISGIFGDKFGSMANAISGFAGLKGSSTSSLVGSVLPLALGLIGKYAKDNNTTPSALSSLLSGQKNAVYAAMPNGFDVTKYLGNTTTTRTAYQAPIEEKKKNNWLLPLILGLGALLLLLWLMKGCNKKEEIITPVVNTDTVVKQAPLDTTVKTVMVESIKVTLPNGVILDANKGGIEDLLVAFLNDANAKPGNDNWFDFNDLNFTFGTAEIVPESKKQLNNIVEILKAYPKAKIKLGGYTDKVGDEAANKKLSGERASAVAAALKEAGVGAQVTGAEGYGSQFAKYPADAPEQDRLKDRRVSVSVREK